MTKRIIRKNVTMNCWQPRPNGLTIDLGTLIQTVYEYGSTSLQFFKTKPPSTNPVSKLLNRAGSATSPFLPRVKP